MGNWLFTRIPLYKVYLIWVGVLCIFIAVVAILNPHFSKARSTTQATRSQIRQITFMLSVYIKSKGHGPVGSDSAIIRELSANFRNEDFGLVLGRTNDVGELVDLWQTPLQIRMLDSTNFFVRSAGPNKKLNDDDDIVFNSRSNNFVKP